MNVDLMTHSQDKNERKLPLRQQTVKYNTETELKLNNSKHTEPKIYLKKHKELIEQERGMEV